MKNSLCVVAFAAVCLVSCERDNKIADDSTPPPASEAAETRPPAAIPVTEPEDFKVAEEEPGNPEIASPTPGQRLDHAIEKTEQGLGTAAEKTEEGLRKAAEKTGGALQRVGEAIERKASEHSR